MSTISTNMSRPSLIARIRTAVKRQGEYRKMVNELSTLSRREMYDIGIAPGDIYDIARDHALKAVPLV